MSNYYGVNATKALTPTSDNILSGGLIGGKVKTMVDKYEASGLADGSTISIGKALPVGAKVLGVSLSYDALGASATLEVGDAGAAARYLALAAASSAGNRQSIDVDGLGYEITGTSDTQILITLVGGAATGTIAIVVTFTTD